MSMDIAKPHNEQRLLWAGFFSIFAAGVGFSVRGGILIYWAGDFGFTMADLGGITGGCLAGFGIIIILGSLIADNVGYGKLMAVAFAMHILSAVLQLFAGQAALPPPAPDAALGQPGVLRAVLMAGAYPALIALTGLGIGAITRHTAGAICADSQNRREARASGLQSH